jgi:salicylate hydroxylase
MGMAGSSKPSLGGPVLIAGGGIGGLALALALAATGIESRVLERRARFEEAGAGIQIGPNGMRLLTALGVRDALASLSGRPSSITVRSAEDGRVLSTLPLGLWLEARHGAPYWTLHRQDLHTALLERARAEPRVEIVCGFEVTAAEPEGTGAGGIRAIAADGRGLAGRLLVGADGLWSSVRRIVDPASALEPVGKTAMRTVIAGGRLPSALNRAEVALWLAEGLHVVHYPVRGGEEVAIVIVMDDDRAEAGWDLEIPSGRVQAAVDGYAAALVGLVREAPFWRKWSLYAAAPPPARWVRGSVVLLGDAAHPVMPFLAQGAVLALEDGAVLARELSSADVDQALAAYQRQRRPRAERVAAASKRNGEFYHLGRLGGAARNLAMSALGGRRIMSGYDWLYGWRR